MAAVGAKTPNLRFLDWSHLFMQDAGVAWLAAGASRISGLNLEGCHQITDDGGVAIADNCMYLTELNLKGCLELTDRTMTAFSSHSLKWRRIEKVRLQVGTTS